MADLTDAVGNSDKSSLLATWGGHESSFPTELEIETGVGAADEENETKIAGTNVEGSDEHAAACCAEDYGNHNVVVGFLEATGSIGETASDCVCDGVGWSLDEVGGQSVEFEGLHNL